MQMPYGISPCPLCRKIGLFLNALNFHASTIFSFLRLDQIMLLPSNAIAIVWRLLLVPTASVNYT